MLRSCRRLALAIGPIVAATVAGARDARGATPPPPPVITDYSILHHVQLGAYVAQPVNSPPINGFIPSVVFTLTDEAGDQGDAFAVEDSHTAGSQPAPISVPPRYFVATFDTGAQSHIVSIDDRAASGLDAHLTGNQADLIGSSGTETADVSNPLGVYVAGLSSASAVGSDVTVSGAISGHWNTSVLVATDEDSVLPNIIGAPVAASYQVAIRNSQPQTLTVGVTTFQSPNVTLTSLETAPPLPSSYYRLTLDVMSPAGLSPTPIYNPSVDIFSPDFGEPTTSTFWMSMFANVSGVEGTLGSANKQFLFDTGAQVTVFSQDTAAEYGFFSGGPEPSTPEFIVDVQGVGGTIQVPGFFVDSLQVMTNGGPVVWNNVPVLVLDLPDARDGVGFLPGVLGMNLFTDRDLILNGGLTNPAVSFSSQFQWWQNASGLWSDATKWTPLAPSNTGVAPHDGMPANFLGKITSPQTITVNGDYTVSSMTFDNANRYTLSGAGRLTLRMVEGPSVIGVYNGSHTINAPMTFLSDTVINVTPPASKLTITNDVIATGIDVTKTGAGTVEMKNVRTDTLALNGGTVSIIAGGGNGATSVVKSISASSGGTLDLQNNKLLVKGAAGGGTADLGAWNGTAYTGITGLLADDSIVTTQPNPRAGLAIASAEQAQKVGQTFGGQLVGAGDVLVMYTWAGDANLSGDVDGDDYFRIDTGFAGNLKGYFNGDFDLNGRIDVDDYFLIDSSYSATPAFASGVTAVPEPSAIACAFAGFMALRRRKKVS